MTVPKQGKERSPGAFKMYNVEVGTQRHRPYLPDVQHVYAAVLEESSGWHGGPFQVTATGVDFGAPMTAYRLCFL
jgi:hypothetical protein